MPHQCLGCGHAFEEGSSAILQGCPSCKGTRFFYTAKPVDDTERKRIKSEAKKDLRAVVADVLRESAPEAVKELEASAGEDGWAELKPKDLRKLVNQVKERKDGADTFTPSRAPASAKPVDLDEEPLTASEHARRRAQVAEAAKELLKDTEPEGDEKPDTVTINEPGDYQIDVQRLMDKDPIVVQRDGAYMIHLPSLFQDGGDPTAADTKGKRKKR